MCLFFNENKCRNIYKYLVLNGIQIHLSFFFYGPNMFLTSFMLFTQTGKFISNTLPTLFSLFDFS